MLENDKRFHLKIILREGGEAESHVCLLNSKIVFFHI